jgi:hypothetical protein
MALSGEAHKGLQIAGNAANIVSNQKQIGQPTTFEIGGTREDQASLKFDGALDYLGEIPKENFTLNLAQIPLSNVKLTNFALLPSRIEQGKVLPEATFRPILFSTASKSFLQKRILLPTLTRACCKSAALLPAQLKRSIFLPLPGREQEGISACRSAAILII